MAKGNLLVVSYHFFPSPEVGAKRPSETALYLAGLGYDVTVLRATERELRGRPIERDLTPLELVSVRVPPRIWTALWIRSKAVLRRLRGPRAEPTAAPGAPGEPGPGRMSAFGWLRRQLLAFDTLFQGNKRWLMWSVLRTTWALRRRRIDVVIASGPPMVSYIAGWLMARIKGARLILDFRDPWYLHGDPELSTVMLGHPLANFENGLASTCGKRAAISMAASPGTKRYIVERLGVDPDDVVVIRNGFDEHARVDEPPPRGRLEMLYAGSLYWNRNPFPFLEALAAVLERPDVDRSRVRCRLVGNCAEWKGIALAPWIAEHGLENVVEIRSFVSPAELRDLIADSNVLLNFAQGQKRQIPAKSYDYIASRREVIVITEPGGDVANLFEEAGVGLVVEPQDQEGFAAAIDSMYARFVTDSGAAVAEHSIEPYSRRVQLERIAAVVADVVGD